jgi:hypothetical protein
METGVHQTLDELAKAERVNPSYVSRILRLTLLSPKIVEGLLDQRQSTHIRFDRLMKPFPTEWSKQLSDGLEGAMAPRDRANTVDPPPSCMTLVQCGDGRGVKAFNEQPDA